jgi:hypothetical protein
MPAASTIVSSRLVATMGSFPVHARITCQQGCTNPVLMRLLLALDGLDAVAVARGLTGAGLPQPDLYDPAEGLDATFDARMRAAFAVVVGEPRLDRGTLRGRVTGEIATRARQAGVPCHAIAADDALDTMGKRILDLQYVFVASTPVELEGVGVMLARRLTTDVMRS